MWASPGPTPYTPNSDRAMAPAYRGRYDGSFPSRFRSSDRLPFGLGGCCRRVAAAAKLSGSPGFGSDPGNFTPDQDPGSRLGTPTLSLPKYLISVSPIRPCR